MTSSGADSAGDAADRRSAADEPAGPSSSWFDDVFARGADAGDHPTTGVRPDYAAPVAAPDSAPDVAPGVADPWRAPLPADRFDTEPTAPLFPVGAIGAAGGGGVPPHGAWMPPVDRPADPPPSHPGRGGLRPAAVITAVALTAALFGGAAGYGGTRLAAWQSARATPTQAVPASGPAASSATPAAAPAGTANTVAIARKVLPSTVTIKVAASAGATTGGTGSGLVLDRAGRILTNNHVVEAAGDDGRLQVVNADGSVSIARLVGRSPSYDLAVIQVDASPRLVPAEIGNSDQTRVGDPAVAIGSPLGLGGTVTAGIISAKDRPVAVAESSDADAPSAYIDALQTDAPINPGNSGGPLVDAAGRVVGVNSAILTLGGQGQTGNIGLGFAIPINQAMRIADELIRDGHATYPVLGASVTDTTTDGGVLLQDVQPGQPAARAGLQAGDVITEIDGRTITAAPELIVAVRAHRPGDTVALGYERGSISQQATVTLGSKEG